MQIQHSYTQKKTLITIERNGGSIYQTIWLIYRQQKVYRWESMNADWLHTHYSAEYNRPSPDEIRRVKAKNKCCWLEVGIANRLQFVSTSI